MRVPVGGVECNDGKREIPRNCRWRRAKQGGDMPFAERRADVLRAETLRMGRKGCRASGDGASAPSRTRGCGRAEQGGEAAPGARAAPARSAAPRCATPGTAQKKGASPSPKQRTGPGGSRRRRPYAATVITGMPSCRALSTRFPVIPLPGNAMTPFGRRLSSSSLPPEGCCLAVSVPVGAADDLIDAACFGPARCDLLDSPGPPPCSRIMSPYFSRAPGRAWSRRRPRPPPACRP